MQPFQFRYPWQEAGGRDETPYRHGRHIWRALAVGVDADRRADPEGIIGLRDRRGAGAADDRRRPLLSSALSAKGFGNHAGGALAGCGDGVGMGHAETAVTLLHDGSCGAGGPSRWVDSRRDDMAPDRPRQPAKKGLRSG
jgi:hypothetical protein